MPLIKNPATGATWDVPQAVVRHWTTTAGWQLAEPAVEPPRRARRARQPVPPLITPTAQGGDEDDPSTDSSTTEHNEE